MAPAKQEAASSKKTILSPTELRKMTRDAEAALLKEVSDAQRAADAEKKAVRDAFMARELRADVLERVNAAVERAAKARSREIELFRFPATFCNDGGRAVNNNEPTWPDTLEGFARRAYDAYARDLKPAGYKLKAQVMGFEGGKMGDIALFLLW